jgi:hypothetical protein
MTDAITKLNEVLGKILAYGPSRKGIKKQEKGRVKLKKRNKKKVVGIVAALFVVWGFPTFADSTDRLIDDLARQKLEITKLCYTPTSFSNCMRAREGQIRIIDDQIRVLKEGQQRQR